MNMSFALGALTKGLGVKRHKVGFGSMILLLFFSGMFAAFGLFAIKNQRIDDRWLRVSGQVVEVSSKVREGKVMYTAIVSYSVGSQVYQVSSGISSSLAPTMGETREVAYNPEQPNQARVVQGGWITWLFWSFPIIGALTALSAMAGFVQSILRSVAIRQLKRNGQKIQGVLTDIRSAGGGKKNNGIFTIVVSAINPSGMTQSYQSDLLSGIGGLAMSDYKSSPIAIDVYIDPMNPEKYYVDIEDIPDLTPERVMELVQAAKKRLSPDDSVKK